MEVAEERLTKLCYVAPELNKSCMIMIYDYDSNQQRTNKQQFIKDPCYYG